MTGLLPCTCRATCQADRACQLPPRFQAQIDVPARAQYPRVRRRATACARHFGALVAAISSWASGQGLDEANLTVLAIDLPPGTRPPGRLPHHNVTRARGLVFSTIPLGTPQVGASPGPPGLPGELRPGPRPPTGGGPSHPSDAHATSGLGQGR